MTQYLESWGAAKPFANLHHRDSMTNENGKINTHVSQAEENTEILIHRNAVVESIGTFICNFSPRMCRWGSTVFNKGQKGLFCTFHYLWWLRDNKQCQVNITSGHSHADLICISKLASSLTPYFHPPAWSSFQNKIAEEEIWRGIEWKNNSHHPWHQLTEVSTHNSQHLICKTDSTNFLKDSMSKSHFQFNKEEFGELSLLLIYKIKHIRHRTVH